MLNFNIKFVKSIFHQELQILLILQSSYNGLLEIVKKKKKKDLFFFFGWKKKICSMVVIGYKKHGMNGSYLKIKIKIIIIIKNKWSGKIIEPLMLDVL